MHSQSRLSADHVLLTGTEILSCQEHSGIPMLLHVDLGSSGLVQGKKTQESKFLNRVFKSLLTSCLASLQQLLATLTAHRSGILASLVGCLLGASIDHP